MPACPKCGRENPVDAVYCAYCSAPLTSVPPAPVVQVKTDVTPIAVVGIVCAFISLLFFPPVFGIIAVVLGAYALSKASEDKKH